MAGKIQNEDLKSSAELISGGGTAAQLPNDDKVWVTALSINKTLKQAIIDGDISGSGAGSWVKASDTLNGTDITNQYIDLGFEASVDTISLVYARQTLIQGVDYTVSYTGGVAGVTRITFAGDFASGGNAALVQNDILYIQYAQA